MMASNPLLRIFSVTIPMPARIDEIDRAVSNVCIPIPRHRVPRVRHDRIRLRKPAQRRVVKSRIVEIQPQALLFPLPGEFIGRGQRPRSVARLSPRLVPRLARPHTAHIRHHRRGAQVVRQQVGELACLPHRQPAAPSIVILPRHHQLVRREARPRHRELAEVCLTTPPVCDVPQIARGVTLGDALLRAVLPCQRCDHIRIEVDRRHQDIPFFRHERRVHTVVVILPLPKPNFSMNGCLIYAPLLLFWQASIYVQDTARIWCKILDGCIAKYGRVKKQSHRAFCPIELIQFSITREKP